MSDRATAERLFEELGPIFDPDAILKYEKAAIWSVLVRDDTRIDVSFEEGDGTFLFLAPLGAVPEDRAESGYEMLLRLSFLVRETGGLHAALDEKGEAVLIYRYPAQDLEVSRLAAVLNNLAAHARVWAATLKDTGPDGSDGPPAVDPAVIRV